MLVFALLVFGTMRWIWPLILGAMEERSRKIAQGLAAAEKGEQELAAARDRAEAIVREARGRANQIIEHAQHLAHELVEQAKGAASSEGARIVAAAQQQIELDTTRAKESLRREVAAIAVRAAAEGVADVAVTSAAALDEARRTRIAAALERRLKRRVRVHCEVDPKLVGGAVLRSGDLVIDGSLRTRLERIAYELTA